MKCEVEECEFSCITRTELNKHRREQHPDANQRSSSSTRTLELLRLETKIQTRHETETFECGIDGCEHTSNSKATLCKHRKQKHPELELPIGMKPEVNEKEFRCPEENCEHSYCLKDSLRRHRLKMHPATVAQAASQDKTDDKKRFTCGIYGCAHTCLSTAALARHRKQKHPGEKIPLNQQVFKCPQDNCICVFRVKSSLINHLKLHSAAHAEAAVEAVVSRVLQEPVEDADDCKDQTLEIRISTRAASKSKKLAVGCGPRRKFECGLEGCDHSCFSKSSLSRHRKEQHPEVKISMGRTPKVNEKSIPCPEENCDCMFSRHCSMAKHLLQQHSVTAAPQPGGDPTLICGFCPLEAPALKDRLALIQHLNDVHFANDYEKIQLCKKTFGSMEEFEQWLEGVELKTRSKFIKGRGASKRGSSGTAKHLYYCHRSKQKVVSESTGIRAARKRGSNKVDFTCSAYLTVLVAADGSVKVSGCIEHYGHDNLLERLPMPKRVNERIKELCEEGLGNLEIARLVSAEVSRKGYWRQVIPKDVRNVRLLGGFAPAAREPRAKGVVRKRKRNPTQLKIVKRGYGRDRFLAEEQQVAVEQIVVEEQPNDEYIEVDVETSGWEDYYYETEEDDPSIDEQLEKHIQLLAEIRSHGAPTEKRQMLQQLTPIYHSYLDQSTSGVHPQEMSFQTPSSKYKSPKITHTKTKYPYVPKERQWY